MSRSGRWMKDAVLHATRGEIRVDSDCAEPRPPRSTREAEGEEASCATGGGGNERLAVGVAADDPVHDDHVGFRKLLGRVRKVDDPPLDAILDPSLAGQLPAVSS